MNREGWLRRKLLLIFLIILAWPTIFSAISEVPRWARDMDCDGKVSISEWYTGGIDRGWRPATGGPSGCMEVYRIKDGALEVVRCEEPPRCRLPGAAR